MATTTAAVVTVFALHKPKGIKCDLSVSAPPNPHRPKDLKTWFDTLAPDLRHIGRLDKATTGLLLATTACAAGGALTTRLLTPGNVSKTYVATCRATTNTITQEQQDALLTDMTLNDGPARFDSIAVREIRTTTFGEYERHEIDIQVTLRIGRNRIVRRLLAAHKLPVCKLHREAIGGLKLSDLSIPNTSDSVQLNTMEIARLWSGKASDNNTKGGNKRSLSEVTCRERSNTKKLRREESLE